jgi:tetratricopeptide (TPR) repeat protein
VQSYRALGDELAIGLHFEALGDAGKAVAAFAQFAAGSAENRERLLSAVPEVKSRRSALKAALRLSALGMADKAGPLFLQAGELDLAARDLERAGDYPALAGCREQMGRFLEAAQAMEKTGPEGRELLERIQGLLYRHLTEEATDARPAAEALYNEALAMQADGRLVPALARLRLLQESEHAQEVFFRLGWHEDAVRYLVGIRARPRSTSGGRASPSPLSSSIRWSTSTGRETRS